MKQLLFFLMLWLLPPAALYSQDCPDTIYLSMDQSFVGTNIKVDIEAIKFSKIQSFQFGIKFDPQILQLQAINSIIPAFNQGNFILDGQGFLRIVWFDMTQQSVTFPDFSKVFTLEFKPLQKGITSIIRFTEEQLPFEFSNINSEKLCTSVKELEVFTGGFLAQGSVVFDQNKNCNKDEQESTLPHWLLEFSTGSKSYYRSVDVDGKYAVMLPLGVYDVKAIPINPLWDVCNNNVSVDLTVADGPIIDFYAQIVTACPLVKTNVGSPLLQRCKDNVYTVYFENTGTDDATEAQIEVQFDNDLNFISTDYPDFFLNDQVLVLNVGKLGVGERGQANIVFNLNCTSTIEGQSHCVIVKSLPKNECFSNPEWNGSEVKVNVVCDSDNDKVLFTIVNQGSGATSGSGKYIVTEDDVMSPPQPMLLDPLQIKTIELPANGTTYRLTAPQDMAYPFKTKFSTAAIEGCGKNINGSFSLGYVNIFPENDQDVFEDADCQESANTLKLNQMYATPKGYGVKNYIVKDVLLDYVVAFQNTTNDTVSKVVVKSYLPENLDITTLEMGASNHTYSYQFNQERELIITFDDILLTNSSSNENSSKAFVKYKIAPKKTVLTEEIIEHKAFIILGDFGKLETNVVRHTIGENFIMTSIDWYDHQKEWQIYPNPAQYSLIVKYGDTDNLPLQYQIFDQVGKCCGVGICTDANDQIPVDHLKAGAYFIKLTYNKSHVATANIIKL